MSHIHLVGGEKGGVGKSTVARLLAQAFIDRKQSFVALDGDRSHADLRRFYRDYTLPLNLNDNASADAILISAVDEDQKVLVDLPAQSADALNDWIDDSDMLALADELAIPVTIWHVTDGSRNSVELLKRVVDRFGDVEGVSFVVVRNFGRGGNFDGFDASEARADALARGARIIDLPALDGNVMGEIDWKDLSFWAAANRVGGECLSVINRRRAKAWYERWQQQLDKVTDLIPNVVTTDHAVTDMSQSHSAQY